MNDVWFMVWVWGASFMSWGTFRARKKIFSPPPRQKQSPIRRTHPPGPIPSWNPPPPFCGIFNKRTDPPPWRFGLPFPLPEQKKIKNIRNVHQVYVLGGYCVFMYFVLLFCVMSFVFCVFVGGATPIKRMRPQGGSRGRCREVGSA